MDRLQDRFDLLPVLLLLSLLYSPDQEVLWRVFHVDEFQDLDPVPHGLEDLRAQSVAVSQACSVTTISTWSVPS